MYVFPMTPGKLSGTPVSSGQGLQTNPGGQTVYDPVANVMWLANANLAASSAFGLPLCQNPTASTLCVNSDGAMSLDSANQFIANMDAAAYLGQKNWIMPAVDQSCSGYNYGSNLNPMGELFYGQFGLSKGMSAVAAPNIATGPFHNFQPYIYWSCLPASIQTVCQSDGPVANQEWSFSPGESPAIAPNTWIETKGANLAPASDSRIWQGSDFTGNQMPQQLDRVSATVNGKSAYVYYISPAQINVLTPPDAIGGAVRVVVTNNGAVGASFTAQARALSPSLFVFGGGPYIAATHCRRNAARSG